MKILLYILPFLLFSQMCNAQNNSNMQNSNNICGGIVSNNQSTNPLENVSGNINHFYLNFYRGHSEDSLPESITVLLNDNKIEGSILRQDGYDIYKIELESTPKLREQISNALKNSGLLVFNNWDVNVAGLPQIYDMTLEAGFSSGERLFINFNGGRCPDKIEPAADNFTKFLCQLFGYSPEKCVKSKPYVSPYFGKHTFVYNKDGKTQTFIFTVENNTVDNGNAEVISKGDFGYMHVRCYTSSLGDCYHFSILKYYDDSEITTEKQHSLAGIIYYRANKFTLEPLRACPDLPDRTHLQQVD